MSTLGDIIVFDGIGTKANTEKILTIEFLTVLEELAYEVALRGFGYFFFNNIG